MRTRPRTQLAAVVASAALALGVAACGDDSDDDRPIDDQIEDEFDDLQDDVDDLQDDLGEELQDLGEDLQTDE